MYVYSKRKNIFVVCYKYSISKFLSQEKKEAEKEGSRALVVKTEKETEN